MTTARLGFAVDSSQAAKAAIDLDKLVVSAGKAEAAEKRVSRASKDMSAALGAIQQVLQSIDRNTATAAAGIDRFGQSTERASQSLGRADVYMQRFIDRTTGVSRATQQWEGPLANINGELDRLRAKFNPLFAASKQYEVTLDEINRAHALGAINAQEQASAIDRLNAEYQAMTVTARTATAAMAGTAGASRAAQFQSNNLRYQLFDIAQTAALGMNPLMILMQQGPQIAQIYGPEEGGVARAFKEMGLQIATATLYLSPFIALAGAGSLAILAMQEEINAAGNVTVSFGDVALATFQVIRDAILTTLNPAISAIGATFDFVWTHIKNGTKGVVNLIINSFRAAAVDVEFAVMALPDAFIVAGQAAAQGFLNSMVFMAREAVSIVNGVLSSVNGVARSMGLDNVVGLLDAPSSLIPDVNVDFGGGAASERLRAAAGARNARISEIMSSDPLGSFFDAVSTRATENALRDVEDAAGGAGGAIGKAANDNIDPWKGLRGATDEATDAMERNRSIAESLGSTIAQTLRDGGNMWDAFKEKALDAIAKIGESWLTSGIEQMLGGFGGGGGGGGLFGGLFSWLGFAKGAAFQAGNVVPFAGGGVVSSATAFPMANGRTGLMGEAGPEAIMPLKRGRDGKLGVAAGGSGGQSAANQNLQITQHFHISGAVSSRDVEQMVRRGSEQAVAVVKDALPSWNTDIQVYGKPA